MISLSLKETELVIELLDFLIGLVVGPTIIQKDGIQLYEKLTKAVERTKASDIEDDGMLAVDTSSV